MNLAQFKKLKIPDCPGVYSFIKEGQTLYIGKATSLRDRLRSYFNPDLLETRGRRLVNMVAVADKIEFEKADSVLEAFIRETDLIKKYQPITNSLAKDNKSFNYVVVTNESYPRVLVERGRNLEMDPSVQIDFKPKYKFGPYPYGAELQEALKILRRIFPYRDTCMPADELPPGKIPRACFNRTIGLCPGVCSGEISRKDYLKIINNIRLFFCGKKSKVIANLKNEMMVHAKKQEFELANLVKKTLYSIEHIKDVSMIKRDAYQKDENNKKASANHISDWSNQDWQGEEARKYIRAESYDIAHMSGKDMVGVMCVMTDNELDRSQYRKFIIKNFPESHDTGALKEVLRRRLTHTEWPLPDLIIIDGGIGQLNAAQETVTGFFKNLFLEYPEKYPEVSVDLDGAADSVEGGIPPVVSVVKNDAHKAREILYTSTDEILIKKISNLISQEKIFELNAETHRFAITFHKKKRGETFLGKENLKRIKEKRKTDRNKDN